MHPFPRDAAQLGKGEHLESPTVGQNRTIPSHEAMEATQFADDCITWPYMEMVRVPQDDFCPEVAKLVGRDGFHRGLGADRHKDRRLDITPAGMQNSCTSLTGGIGLEKGEWIQLGKIKVE